MNFVLQEHLRIRNGDVVESLVRGEGHELMAQVYSTVMSTASGFVKAARLGSLSSIAGYDVSGGFRILTQGGLHEAISVSFTTGWSFSVEHYDTSNPVTEHFCAFSRTGKYEPFVRSNIFLLPFEAHLRILRKIDGFQFAALRPIKGFWRSLIDDKSVRLDETQLAAAYSCLKVIFSQKLPRSRILLTAEKGIVCAWRSINRSCGLVVFREYDTSQNPLIASSIEGLITNLSLID